MSEAEKLADQAMRLMRLPWLQPTLGLPEGWVFEKQPVWEHRESKTQYGLSEAFMIEPGIIVYRPEAASK